MLVKGNISIAALILIGGLALSGCTININNPASDFSSGMMGESGMMGHSASKGFSSADIMFAQMMIPHHQQAVDMGTVAETRALSPEVKALAAKIKAEQAPEITSMKGWLKSAHASLDMGHEMGMGGMLSDQEMMELKNASGAQFDRLYLQGMIQHHKGAIRMAQLVKDSDNAVVRKLARSIITSQTEQITYMEQLLAK